MEERGTIHSGTRRIIPLWKCDMQEEVEGGPGAFSRCRKPDMNKSRCAIILEPADEHFVARYISEVVSFFLELRPS